MAGHEERVRELERELDSLRARVEEKDNTAVRAAELGQALLRENEVLEERLNQVNKEATLKIEARDILRLLDLILSGPPAGAGAGEVLPAAEDGVPEGSVAGGTTRGRVCQG